MHIFRSVMLNSIFWNSLWKLGLHPHCKLSIQHGKFKWGTCSCDRKTLDYFFFDCAPQIWSMWQCLYWEPNCHTSEKEENFAFVYHHICNSYRVHITWVARREDIDQPARFQMQTRVEGTVKHSTIYPVLGTNHDLMSLVFGPKSEIIRYFHWQNGEFLSK